MPITVGEQVPDVEVRTLVQGAPVVVRTGEVLGRGRVVLFAVPGAFTPTCSDHHLPGFILRRDELAEKGVDTVACLSVNDAYVMGAWGRSQRVEDTIVMLGDGNGEFTRAMGLEVDLAGAGLGLRSKRYAAIIEDGIITSLFVESAGLDVSSAESVLKAL